MISRWASLIFVAVAVGAGCTLPPSPDHQAAKQRWASARAAVKLQLAQERFDVGLIDDAQVSLKEAASLDGELAGMTVLQVKLALARGDWVQAERLLGTATADPNADAEMFYLLGTVHQRNRDWHAADQCYRHAVNRQPNNADYALAVAENLLVLQRPEEALKWLRARDQVFDDPPTLHLLLAQCHELRGAFGRAAREYEVVKAEVGESPWLCEALGFAYYWSGQPAPAASVFEKAIALTEKAQLSPTTALRVALVDCLLQIRQPGRAREQLALMLREHPEDAQLWMLMAVAWEAGGQTQRALRCAQQACRRQPECVEAKLLQGILARRAGQEELAEESLEVSQKLSPQDVLRQAVERVLSRRAYPFAEEPPADDWVGPPPVARYVGPRLFTP